MTTRLAAIADALRDGQPAPAPQPSRAAQIAAVLEAQRASGYITPESDMICVEGRA
jgi:hypothetical protein